MSRPPYRDEQSSGFSRSHCQLGSRAMAAVVLMALSLSIIAQEGAPPPDPIHSPQVTPSPQPMPMSQPVPQPMPMMPLPMVEPMPMMPFPGPELIPMMPRFAPSPWPKIDLPELERIRVDPCPHLSSQRGFVGIDLPWTVNLNQPFKADLSLQPCEDVPPTPIEIRMEQTDDTDYDPRILMLE